MMATFYLILLILLPSIYSLRSEICPYLIPSFYSSWFQLFTFFLSNILPKIIRSSRISPTIPRRTKMRDIRLSSFIRKTGLLQDNGLLMEFQMQIGSSGQFGFTYREPIVHTESVNIQTVDCWRLKMMSLSTIQLAPNMNLSSASIPRQIYVFS